MRVAAFSKEESGRIRGIEEFGDLHGAHLEVRLGHGLGASLASPATDDVGL